ncbi:YaaR family protein [Virgibacillus flavescens]|uniref:YaaR family protein n=1 Tax=Virgibacillus flavescens TaxID=1611422 RepID=UPI003D343EFF
MKISQDLRSQVDATNKHSRSSFEGKQSFDGLVQTQSHKLKAQELQLLMKGITVQGEKLAKFRSFKDLVKFKRMVKGFLQETVYNGLDLKQSHSFGLESRNQKLSIVKEIDSKLIELTEELMNQERKSVDLLGLIGEIKGLLINLYT